MKFDLRNEPWIPCLDTDGLRQMSLVDVLTQAHEIKEIVGETPPITIALHRLLLAILHRVFRGPKNAEAWNAVYTRGSFDAERIKEYFDRLPDRFDLFHEKYPFYQTASARGSLQNGAAIQLYFQGKNNSTLFEHSSTGSPKSIAPSEAARLVVAFQGFDFGGLKADGATQMAPLLQSAIALIRGQSLFETLMFNIHRYDGEDGQPFAFDQDRDLPAWEIDDETQNKERWPNGPVDLLTWQPRKLAVELVEGEDGSRNVKNAVVMCGYTFPAEVDMPGKETMMAFRASKEGKMFSVGFSESRALWRNSVSLFASQNTGSTRPRSLDWVSSLRGNRYIGKQKLPIDFYGIAADKAKLLFWSHERFDLPLEFLNDPALTAKLGMCLEFAEATGSAIRGGMKALGDELEIDRTAFFGEAMYWSQMESRFHQLLGGLPLDTEGEMKAWFADTLQIARKAFRDTVNSLSGTAAEVKASVKAENLLWGLIYKAIKTNIISWNKYLPLQFAAKGGKE